MLSASLYLVHEHCIVPRLEAAEKTDAGRVAPISACVFYQIDRLKSGFEAIGRTVMPGNCALMGATRPASELRKRLTDRHVINAVCEPLFSA